MDEELKKELFSAVDESIKKNVTELVGPEVATQVADQVKKLRLERAVSGKDVSGVDDDTKKSFIDGVREIAATEKAAFFEYSDQAGGYLVPQEVHDGILRIAETTGIVPRDARKFPMGSDSLEIPRYTGSVLQGEYHGEDEEADETNVDIGVARLFAKEWILIFRMSNALLADARVDVADWLMALAAEGMAYRLDREGFQGGTFVGSPFVGLLQSGDVTVHTMASGATGFEDFGIAEASKAIGEIPTAALQGAAFYFHRSVWAQIRARQNSGVFEFSQFNPFMGRLSKENGIAPVGEILGYPVYTTDVLPAYSASAVSTKFGVFGNVSQALFWGDKGPMAIAKSTDATVGGKSLFRANQSAIRLTHRHAVSIGLPAAAAVLKTAAS